MAQIQARSEATRSERVSYLEEGRRIRQQQQQEKARLEQVRKGGRLGQQAGAAGGRCVDGGGGRTGHKPAACWDGSLLRHMCAWGPSAPGQKSSLPHC